MEWGKVTTQAMRHSTGAGHQVPLNMNTLVSTTSPHDDFRVYIIFDAPVCHVYNTGKARFIQREEQILASSHIYSPDIITLYRCMQVLLKHQQRELSIYNINPVIRRKKQLSDVHSHATVCL